MSVFQFIPESFDQGVAQLLGGYFGSDLCIAVLRVVIAPSIVLVFGDLSGAVFLGNNCLCKSLFGKFSCFLASAGIDPEKHFTISDFDGKTVTIFQCEQCMHDTETTVNVRNIESKWRYVKSG